VESRRQEKESQDMTALSGPRLDAKGEATHLVVLVHGYGADGNDLLGLAPHWQQFLPSVAFSAPNAPEPCAGSPMGHQWFPISRMDPAEMARGVAGAAPLLDAYLDAELARLSLPPERLALVGFSQGTMMSLHVGLRREVAAIVGYSGMLAAPPPALDARAPPVLLVHGGADPMIPADALFLSAGALGQAGAAVQWHVSPGVGHSIDEAGLILGAEFLSLALQGRLGRGADAISCPL
jgi:phospholipase/carboxylesterase